MKWLSMLHSILAPRRKRAGRLVGYAGEDKRRQPLTSLNPMSGAAVTIVSIKGTGALAGRVNGTTGKLSEVLKVAGEC